MLVALRKSSEFQTPTVVQQKEQPAAVAGEVEELAALGFSLPV
jgi:hypothetical protein